MVTYFPPSSRRGRLAAGALRRLRTAARADEGFLLLEVMISAMLLGLVAIATLTGLQAVNAGDVNQRAHNEAVLLAAQSQEELRSDPVSALEKLVGNPHVYTEKLGGSTYTITQEVHELSSKEENTACSVVEHGAYLAPNFRVTSIVTWNLLSKSAHPVKESSIITPPTSSSLEVDVGNAPSPTAGVGGVNVIVTYAAFETASQIRLEGTTSSSGCVLFTGIRATSANVEIGEKLGFVTPSGALAVPSAEVSIAPNLANRDEVTYNEGGAISAQFTYKGKTEFEGKKITGDTFVVSNDEMSVAPELEIGTAGTFTYETGGEEHYTASTSSYNVSALTAKGPRYEHGDLFPFPASSWTAYAGDCAANNPASVTKGEVSPSEGLVASGYTKTLTVPMSYMKLEAHKGTEKSPSASLDAEPLPVKITNTSCSAATPAPATPNNAASVSYTHTQRLSGGALEAPFQPFGKFEICVQAYESASEPSKDRIDKFIYENTAAEGARPTIYPEERPQAEEQKIREEQEAKTPERIKRVAEETTQTKEREEEATNKPKRESEESTLKKGAEEEATNKTKRESEEASNKKKWEEEEKAKFGKKITKAERETKEKEQAKIKAEDEAKEKTAKEKRAKEEETLKKKKEEEEAAKTTRVKEEAKTSETKTREEKEAAEKKKEEEKKATEKTSKAAKGEAQTVEWGTTAKC
jgi:Tfp pilus assembly protein PilV